MSKPDSHKLFVSYKEFKFVQLARGKTSIDKLLRKASKSFRLCYPGQGKPKFTAISEEGFVIPLAYCVEDVFGPKAYVCVHCDEKGERVEKKIGLGRADGEVLANKVVKREEGKKDEAKKEESRKEEVKKTDEKESRNEIGKKKNRHERYKESQPNKHVKIDEGHNKNLKSDETGKHHKAEDDRKASLINELIKKDSMISSESEDSDRDIFAKDEKKPNLSKVNLFKN